MSIWIYALATLDDVKGYIGNVPQKDGIWVYCSQADATGATVEITSTTIILKIIGGAQAGTNTLTFADADKDTISELIIAINALTGWKAGTVYPGTAPSTDLVVTGALSCLSSANEITLKVENNYFIDKLINAASDLIERYCNRKIDSRTYTKEVYYGTGYNRLILDEFPVTRVMRLSSGRTNSFSIKNTSTDANYCTVEVTSTEIKLIVNGGANVSSNELLLSTYTTIDLLIAAIHALGKGWVCTTLATDTGTRDASELLIRPSMAVTDTAQAYCETVDEDITDYKLLNPTEARNEGIIEMPGVFTAGHEYFVTYVAGYTTIPYSLEQACIELVKYKYDQSKRDSGLKSESFGEGADYSYTLQDLKNGLPADLLDELDMFKKRSF
jgi:hypothetical protein